MRLLRSIEELVSVERPLHVAIGVFDGVHSGHRAVIEAAQQSARLGGTEEACVVTFDPHPARVLAPDSAPRLLTSTRHKLLLLRELGIETVAVIDFDRDFAETPAEDFVRQLHRHSRHLRQICVGEDWRFGRGGVGNVALLDRLGRELGFSVNGVPTVIVDGMAASSTRIREAVAGGDFEIAARLLGRPYSVLGTVIEGRKLGRELGFPTANLTVHSEQLPPSGVYAVQVTGDRIPTPTSTPHHGVANLGYRPSVEGGTARRLLEVHLLDWSGDLYGQDLEVRFVEFLRPEKRFEGLEALKTQISLDADQARAVLRST